MYRIVRATLLLKKSLRKRVKEKESSKSTIYLQNVQTYKIFSPKALHAILAGERWATFLFVFPAFFLTTPFLHPSFPTTASTHQQR
jgi:hypothetical protein